MISASTAPISFDSYDYRVHDAHSTDVRGFAALPRTVEAR